jgi:hypothetical protein
VADEWGFAVRGVREFEQTIDNLIRAQERASLAALNAGVKEIATLAKANVGGQEHPQSRSGALRRSIRWWGAKPIAPGVFAARAGPSRRSKAARYARPTELGNPRWVRRTGYPYLKPAERAVRRELAAIYRRAWTQGQKQGTGR